MNSILFNKDFLFCLIIVLALILFFWNVFLQWQIWKIKRKFKILFNGQKASNLEGVIFEQIKRLRKTEKDLQKLCQFSENLEKMALKSIQKVGIVRFNPFKDVGGDQSFAIALLDSFDNGVVISTLFTREGSRTYCKPIEKGLSKYNLSKEEEKAIKEAQNSKIKTAIKS